MKYLVIYTDDNSIISVQEWAPGGAVATTNNFIVSTRADLEEKFPGIELPVK